jgi:pimeloyl-ACP methyl ester carboxylesterase
VAGQPVRYLEGGAGRVLLLAHGYLGSAENFDTWLPTLTRIRRVVIPDLPGFGQTPPLRVPAVASLAGWLKAFAEHLGLGPVELGGLCLGATLALDYAARWPEQVEALLLHTPICSPAMVRARFKLQVAALTSQPFFSIVDSLRRNRTVSDLYKRWVVEGADVDPEGARVNFDNQVRADGSSARAWLRDGLKQNYEEMLAAWPKPALILAAEDDRLLELARLRRLAARMPHARLTVIPQAGHGWNAALIAAQVKAIEEFLRTVAA